MNETPLAAQADAWRGELLRTARMCATYYARRVPHWIAIGNRIWGSQLDSPPWTGQSIPDELMACARREIELRGEYTRRILGELAERSTAIPSSSVLTDCTQLAGELISGGCRDVGHDVLHASRFLHGVDAACATDAIARAINEIADHLLDVLRLREEFRP